MMKVCKFGGTSLASAEQIKKVCEIIVSDSDRRIAVVSAPGKRFSGDTKVTDLLIETAKAFISRGEASEELSAVVERYDEICDDLGLDVAVKTKIKLDLEALLELDCSNTNKFTDALKAAGEDNVAKLTAEYLKKIGYSANYINPKDAGLFLSDEFGSARVLNRSFNNLKKFFSTKNSISIFPGFFGYSPDGSVVTFSRGGSDITGSILAAAVNADVYENFTDVNSVFAANPKIIDNPAPISEITYREMRELSYAGFTVLHEETLAPVYKAGIPVNIRNTNNPNSPGTMIVPSREVYGNVVAGIAGDRGFCSVYVSKYLMNREIGFGRKLLQIFEEEGLSYEHTPSGIDDISVILRESNFTTDIEEKITARIKNELNIDSISVIRDSAMIIIVGEGMRYNLGISSKATSALARAGINIEMLNQGSSEISIMIGVKGSDCEKAIKAIYNEFFSSEK